MVFAFPAGKAENRTGPEPSLLRPPSLPLLLCLLLPCFDAVSCRVLALLFKPGANHINPKPFHNHPCPRVHRSCGFHDSGLPTRDYEP